MADRVSQLQQSTRQDRGKALPIDDSLSNSQISDLFRSRDPSSLRSRQSQYVQLSSHSRLSYWEPPRSVSQHSGPQRARRPNSAGSEYTLEQDTLRSPVRLRFGSRRESSHSPPEYSPFRRGSPEEVVRDPPFSTTACTEAIRRLVKGLELDFELDSEPGAESPEIPHTYPRSELRTKPRCGRNDSTTRLWTPRGPRR